MGVLKNPRTLRCTHSNYTMLFNYEESPNCAQKLKADAIMDHWQILRGCKKAMSLSRRPKIHRRYYYPTLSLIALNIGGYGMLLTPKCSSRFACVVDCFLCSMCNEVAIHILKISTHKKRFKWTPKKMKPHKKIVTSTPVEVKRTPMCCPLHSNWCKVDTFLCWLIFWCSLSYIVVCIRIF